MVGNQLLPGYSGNQTGSLMGRSNRKQMSHHSFINMHCDSMHFYFIYLDDLIATISTQALKHSGTQVFRHSDIQILHATESCVGKKLSS
jgi:hypothetical protein